MKKTVTFVSLSLVAIAALFVGIFYLIHNKDRLDLANADDRLALEKNVGFYPASKEAYLGSSGFVDSTVFFKVKVTEAEASQRLQGIPEVSPFHAPSDAPIWWKFFDPKRSQYFKTSDKWPSLFIYDSRGWLYGTVEYD